MREIMFRGKDKLGNWHYGSLHIDTINESDKYYINSNICVDNTAFVEVIKETVGQITDSVDIDGDDIWEGALVNQRSVLVGDDENIDFTGYVKFSEGRWVIDNGKMQYHYGVNIEKTELWNINNSDIFIIIYDIINKK